MMIMDYGRKQKNEYDTKTRGKAYHYVPLSDENKKQKDMLPSFKEVFEVPSDGGIVSSADFYNGIIYFSALDGHVYAVDAKTGKMKWKFHTGGPAASSPLVHKKRLYFGSSDCYFYCLDISGQLVWKKHVGDIVVSSPIGLGDRIFIGNGNGYFFCFSEEGEELWRFRTGDGIAYTPSAANGLIFVGSYDKKVYALDEEGKIHWTFLAGERISSDLVMTEGKKIFTPLNRSFGRMPEAEYPTICCGSYDNYVYALDMEGKPLWKSNCGSSVLRVIGGLNSIYAGTFTGMLYSLGVKTGDRRWGFRAGGMAGGGNEAEGNIYFTSFDQRLHCLSAAGKSKWSFSTGGPIASWPLIIGDRIFFGSTDSLFYCLDIKDRDVKWSFQTGLGFSSSMKEKVKTIGNSLIEYDRKVIKVWKPETSKSSASGSLPSYLIPRGFSFEGSDSYSISSPYKAEKRYKAKNSYDKQ